MIRIGDRFYFGDEEAIISEWIDKNAFVTFQTCPEPWIVEKEAIKRLNLPLNISNNKHNLFYNTLKSIRKEAKDLARQSPVS